MDCKFTLSALLLLAVAVLHGKIRVDVSNETPQSDSIPDFYEHRILIKNAEVHAEAINCDSSAAVLKKTIIDKKGIIVSTTETNSGLDHNITAIVARIPSYSFDDILNDIIKLSKRIISKSISTTDITNNYYQVILQLERKKRIADQYDKMLTASKKVEEIISVERYFTEVGDEIIRLEVEKQALNDKMSLLTVEIKLSQISKALPGADVAYLKNPKNEPGRNTTDAANIFDIGTSYALIALPYILFIGVPIMLIMLWIKKFKIVKR